MTMGRRIVVMRDGLIQQADSPLKLYNEPANVFVAGFIGSPAMNFITGMIAREEGLKFISDGGTLAVPVPYSGPLAPFEGKQVVFGIRPEDAVAGMPP